MPMKPALLIIDIQNDYFSGGKMELFEMGLATANARQLISHFRKNSWPVIFIQHLAIRPQASFFIPETVGAEIHESVRPTENEKVFIKNYPNSFRNTGLHEFLQTLRQTELVVCGAMSHMCVDTTVRTAADLGYACKLISDACATRDLVFNGQKVEAPNVQLAYMAAINGTFAQVLSTREFLNQPEMK